MRTANVFLVPNNVCIASQDRCMCHVPRQQAAACHAWCLQLGEEGMKARGGGGPGGPGGPGGGFHFQVSSSRQQTAGPALGQEAYTCQDAQQCSCTTAAGVLQRRTRLLIHVHQWLRTSQASGRVCKRWCGLMQMTTDSSATVFVVGVGMAAGRPL